jgi:hypothetical protein
MSTTPNLLKRALLVAAASRLVVFVTAVGATYLFRLGGALHRAYAPHAALPFAGVAAHLFNTWGNWDGAWYIRIAGHGYAVADNSAAFSPLLPLLVRGLGTVLGGAYLIAGMIIALAAYFAAMVVLFKFVQLDLGPRVAFWSVVLISVFPTAFFFQAVYTEAPFLLLTLACLYWSRTGRWWLAGLAGLLAVLTRTSAVLLVVPMAVYYFTERGWSWRRADRRLAALALVPVGLGLWIAYQAAAFGQPLLFMHAQTHWRRALALPLVAPWRATVTAVQGARQLLSGQSAHAYFAIQPGGHMVGTAIENIALFLLLGGVVALFVYGLRRLPAALSAWTLMAAGYPLLYPVRYVPLSSYARFVLVTFPLFVALAVLCENRPRLRTAFVALFAVGSIVLTGMFAVYAWVA